MKKALIAIAVACMATASFGYIGVNWGASHLYDSDTKGIATVNEHVTQILWELVYTTSTDLVTEKPTLLVDEAKIDQANVQYRSDDTVLATRIWNNTEADKDKIALKELGADATSLDFNVAQGKISNTKDWLYSSDSFSNGSVYAAVFRFMDDGSIFWACSGMDALTTPAASNMSPANPVSNWNTRGVYITDEFKAAVPEPATMSLLGLGALAMVIRRKLRK